MTQDVCDPNTQHFILMNNYNCEERSVIQTKNYN